MRPYRFATPAYRDLAAELEYLSGHSPSAAKRFLVALDQRLRLAAKFPYMGGVRPEFNHPGLLFLTLGDYLVAYDPASKPLTVMAIRHTSRNPQVIFSDL